MTLRVKFALTLITLFAVMALALGAVMHYAYRGHRSEAIQYLHRDLAAHVATNHAPVSASGMNEAALEDIFHSMMVINPAVEFYLLDGGGKILAYSAPPEKIRRKRVELAPVRAFLAGGTALPIFGDDPRDTSGRKVFSVASIDMGVQGEGYLYIILGGESYTGIVNLLEESTLARVSAVGMAASLILGLLAALVAAAWLTRPLAHLSSAMEVFQKTDFRSVPQTLKATRGPDEIARLTRGFRAMAACIATQMRKLADTDRLRRELIANVSHDLRTPLSALHGFLETLHLQGNELSAEERLRYLAIALKHSERLGHLIDELFDLAKLDARETPLVREPFSIAELVQDTVQKLEIEARRKSVRLDVDLDAPVMPQVEGDIALIERALLNLLENALRYSPENGRVRVYLKPDRGAVMVSVSDCGSGIPPQELPYVFDRFYRAEPHRSGDPQRAGLGLAIAQRIAELHGTRIRVASEPGRGTTFAFNLPATSYAERNLPHPQAV